MSTSIKKTHSRIHQLAKRLEGDIRQKGLANGDKYLTAKQAGDMMSVSTTMAQRALRLLAEKEILVRRRNAGTFVGPGLRCENEIIVKTVHVLWEEENSIYTPAESLIAGIHNSLRDVSINFHFLPKGGDVRYVRELLGLANSTCKTVGFVAIRRTREVYRFLAEIGVPSVIFGTLWPGEPSLPSINIDEHQSGRLLAQHLIEAGHKRMALVTHAQGWPGDNDFLDGVSESLTKANLPHNAMVIRTVPRETTVFSAAVQHLLELPNRPSGIIVRSGHFADLVAKTAINLGISVPGEVEIVFQQEALNIKNLEQLPYPHVKSTLTFQDIANKIGQMLKAASQGRMSNEEKIMIPTKLCGKN